MDAQGRIVTAKGLVVQPGITVPPNSTAVAINAQGQVSAVVAGTTTPTLLGQLTMTRFVNKAGLLPIGDNLFLETPASGTPQDGQANTDGYGDLQQFSLEQSNVEAVTEISDLIAAQRAYEMNAKVISACDQMLQIHVRDDALRRTTMIRLATLSLVNLSSPSPSPPPRKSPAHRLPAPMDRSSSASPRTRRCRSGPARR